MSIKQGEYLRKLRIERELSQEQLAEAMGLSRQSISKWEQGVSTPDIDNFMKLAEFYSVPIESLIKAEELCRKPEFAEEDSAEEKPEKKKRGWLFVSYPIIMVIAYALIGVVLGGKGWAFGWIVLLTIPLFYTGIIAAEKKKPIIFCYPVLVVIIYLLCGILFKLWHPMWIVFLTIPLFYIITAKMKK